MHRPELLGLSDDAMNEADGRLGARNDAQGGPRLNELLGVDVGRRLAREEDDLIAVEARERLGAVELNHLKVGPGAVRCRGPFPRRASWQAAVGVRPRPRADYTHLLLQVSGTSAPALYTAEHVDGARRRGIQPAKSR